MFECEVTLRLCNKQLLTCVATIEKQGGDQVSDFNQIVKLLSE